MHQRRSLLPDGGRRRFQQMLVTDDRDKITVTSTDLAVDILVEHTWPALVSLTSGQVRAAAAPGRPVTGTPQ